MKIAYSQEAIDDLKRLKEFIEIKNPQAAVKMANTILETISQLKAFPFLGIEVNRAPDPKIIRDLIIGKYIIRYLIRNREIYILRLWHHKEDRLSI